MLRQKILEQRIPGGRYSRQESFPFRFRFEIKKMNTRPKKIRLNADACNIRFINTLSDAICDLQVRLLLQVFTRQTGYRQINMIHDKVNIHGKLDCRHQFKLITCIVNMYILEHKYAIFSIFAEKITISLQNRS